MSIFFPELIMGRLCSMKFGYFNLIPTSAHGGRFISLYTQRMFYQFLHTEDGYQPLHTGTGMVYQALHTQDGLSACIHRGWFISLGFVSFSTRMMVYQPIHTEDGVSASTEDGVSAST
jgi:hypothetical protein